MSIELANQNNSTPVKSGELLEMEDYRRIELDQLVHDVESRRGGQGDYTKEKYKRPQESIGEVCAKIRAWVVKRKEEGL